jgi:predicted Fe-S protein YdhL (DUF1289 family)
VSASEDEDDFLDFTPLPAVASPCVNICRMQDGLCEGCGRTLDEIAEWSSATDERRRAILDRIERSKAI